MKKRLSLLLSVVFLFGLFSLPSCSQESKGLLFALNERKNEYSVVGMGDCSDRKLVIPSNHDGLPVTAIADEAFCGEEKIKSVLLPETVKTVGRSAFFGCDNLTEFEAEFLGSDEDLRLYGESNMPDTLVYDKGLEWIEEYAFSGCEDLKRVVFPKTLRKIESNAFLDCEDLTAATFQNTANWCIFAEQKYLDLSNASLAASYLSREYPHRRFEKNIEKITWWTEFGAFNRLKEYFDETVKEELPITCVSLDLTETDFVESVSYGFYGGKKDVVTGELEVGENYEKVYFIEEGHTELSTDETLSSFGVEYIANAFPSTQVFDLNDLAFEKTLPIFDTSEAKRFFQQSYKVVCSGMTVGTLTLSAQSVVSKTGESVAVELETILTVLITHFNIL